MAASARLLLAPIVLLHCCQSLLSGFHRPSDDAAREGAQVLRIVAQVAERSLFLWNNEYIVSLVAQQRSAVLPLVFASLERNEREHWNPQARAPRMLPPHPPDPVRWAHTKSWLRAAPARIPHTTAVTAVCIAAFPPSSVHVACLRWHSWPVTGPANGNVAASLNATFLHAGARPDRERAEDVPGHG